MVAALNFLQWITVALAVNKIIEYYLETMNIILNTNKAKDVLAKLEKENPDFNLWHSISSQLNFILDDFDSSGNHKKQASKERVKEIIIGVQAIREIDAGNPKLADLLCEIDYEYKKLYGLNS
jgi:hypothetical protein